jgi:plastocyanin
MNENGYSISVSFSISVIILFSLAGLLIFPFIFIVQASPLHQSNNTVGLGSGEERALRNISSINLPDNGTSLCNKVTQAVNPINISVYRPMSFTNNSNQYDSTSVPSSTLVTLCVPGFGGAVETTLPVDVVFSVDSSSSMIQNDPSDLRLEAAKSFINRLNATQDQAGIVSWGRSVDFSFGLTHDFEKLKAAIDLVESSGGTNLDAGLAAAIEMLDDASSSNNSSIEKEQGISIPKIIIFLSDGKGDYIPSDSPDSLANVAKERGYKIFTVGLSLEAEPNAVKDLKDIANATGGLYLSSPDVDSLDQIFNQIFNKVLAKAPPSNIDVKIALQPYIILDNIESFSIMPTNINETEEGTVVEWKNISKHVGNFDGTLAANETFVTNFKIGSSRIGNSLPIGLNGSSSLSWVSGDDGKRKILSLPESYIDVLSEVERRQEISNETASESLPQGNNVSAPHTNGNKTSMAPSKLLVFTINPGAADSNSQNPITPTQVTVPVGTNATWINKDNAGHQIVSGTPEKGPDNIFYGEYFDANGGTYSIILDSPGFYQFYDPIWNHIRSNVTVTSNGP